MFKFNSALGRSAALSFFSGFAVSFVAIRTNTPYLIICALLVPGFTTFAWIRGQR